MQIMPLLQSAVQKPFAHTPHTDPGGNPCATQSASFLHSAQSLGGNREPQKLLPAVVLVQTQSAELLQGAWTGSPRQNPGAVWSQLPMPCAWHLFLLCLPSQM